MPFESLREHLPKLHGLPERDTELGALPPVRLASFADDIVVRKGQRLAVRVVARSSDGRLSLDFRDSDPSQHSHGFGLDRDGVRLASLLALSHALEQPVDRRRLASLHISTAPGSWVGHGSASDAGHEAFGLARVFDAVLGALASAWPQRVGAGSCTVGAIVELNSGGETICEAIPGGEGATPQRIGRNEWQSPVLGRVGTAQFATWLSVTQRGREGSGGGGARKGGAGVVRTYSVDAPATVLIGIDRVHNPPHGIDRAGPPCPGRAWIERPGEPPPATISPDSLAPWTPHDLSPGDTLHVETAGGAGHGFGGYGDIEFDPSDWFGSTSDEH